MQTADTVCVQKVGARLCAHQPPKLVSKKQFVSNSLVM